MPTPQSTSPENRLFDTDILKAKAGLVAWTDTVLLVLFSATIFASATLLFVVQPMVGKILIPMLGGAPAVWNTCMVFFQATLLVGYISAHLLTRYVPLRFQIVLFPAALLLAMQTLPMSVSQSEVDQLLAGATPSWWMLWVLLCNVAPVFFMMSMTSPLLQNWFARSGHRQSKDPYFLYAASNIGSILALLAYPLMIEVFMGVTDQTAAWATGFGLFIVLAAGCGITGWFGNRRIANELIQEHSTNNTTTANSLTWTRRAWWVLLAFVPSSLMLGVTTYLSTDVASIPLIWIVPLTIYLLTFVLAFASRQWISLAWAGKIAGVLTLAITFLMIIKNSEPQWLVVPMHLLMFFLVSLFCHGRLAEDRPEAKNLTDFYIWLSLGGVLGGLFNALVAPSLFVTIVEYPLIMALACFLRPSSTESSISNTKATDEKSSPETATNDSQSTPQPSVAVAPADSVMKGLLVATAVFVSLIVMARINGLLVAYCPSVFECLGQSSSARLHAAVLLFIPATIVLAQINYRLRFAIGLTAILGVSLLGDSTNENVVERDRNFYGTIKTEKVVTDSGTLIRMVHGHINHGWQWMDAERKQMPLTYYGTNSGINQIIRNQKNKRDSINVGVIGLGTGSLAALSRSDDQISFYEINPQVVDHAEKHFSFLKDARERGADVELKLGDARLVLESETRSGESNEFDVLAVDAFSSDSIPTHLVTTECLQAYMAHVNQNGVLAFHITNRYMDLEPVVAALIDANDLVGYSCSFQPVNPSDLDKWQGETGSHWILISRNEAALKIPNASDFKELRRNNSKRVWTDDYSNVMSALRN